MVNKSKVRGTLWENSVRDLAIDSGFIHAHRLALGGTLDRGDIWVCENAIVEAKATKNFDLAGACAEAKKEAQNAGVDWWWVAQKRRNHPASRAYAITELGLMFDLAAAALLNV